MIKSFSLFIICAALVGCGKQTEQTKVVTDVDNKKTQRCDEMENEEDRLLCTRYFGPTGVRPDPTLEKRSNVQ